jgi:hypothetical protein
MEPAVGILAAEAREVVAAVHNGEDPGVDVSDVEG